MKLFKDIKVGETFVLHNGQQLIRISPLTYPEHNCLDSLYYQQRFSIIDTTECLTVDELMAMPVPVCDIEPKNTMYTGLKLTKEQQAAVNAMTNSFTDEFKKVDWAEVAIQNALRKQEAIEQGEWVVETKISDNGRDVEVSAVIKGTHGHSSYGWHDNGKTKHVVLRVSSTYQEVPVLRSIITLAEDEARRICRTKNK